MEVKAMIIKSYERLFQVLSLFSINRREISIKEIQKELNIPKTTVFRILQTLVEGGYMEKNEQTHKYSLGFKFFLLGSIVQSNFDVREVAYPIMKKLAESTKETVDLNIIDGLHRICIEKVDSPLEVRSFVRVGERKPLHMGASGKVLLAYTSNKMKQEILEKLESGVNTNLTELEKQLNEIKKRNFHITRGERVPGSFAVASPIFNHEKQMIASLTLAGPIQRLTEEKELEF